MLERSAAVTVTASGTPHAKGGWSELIASTAANGNWVSLWITGSMQTSATDTRGLLDLGIGAAASETAIVTEIPVGFVGNGMCVTLPIWVPAASRLSARLQSLIASDTLGVMAYVHTSGLTEQSPTSLVTLNADTAASTSTTMMTVSNTWTQVIASTSQDFCGLVAVMCGGASNNWSADNTEVLSVGVGGSGAEVEVGKSHTLTWTNSESITTIAAGGFANQLQAHAGLHVPSGSRVATKITTGRAYKGAIVFGVPYP